MKRFAYGVAVLLIGALAYIGLNWRSCSGWRDCYFSWRLFWSGSSPADGLRQRAIMQFAASTRWIAFPVALDGQSTALLLIDRGSGQRRLITEEGRSFSSPYLSPDDERLVHVGRDRSGRLELMSCTIRTWDCDVFLQTENRVISPVELDKDTLVYR